MQDGIKEGMPDAEYRAIDRVSKSSLDWLARSPQHYQFFKKNPPSPTNAMTLGSAIHCAVLEPWEFSSRYVCAPDIDRRTKDGKAAWADFQAGNVGKVAMSEDDWRTIDGICGALTSNDLTRGIIAPIDETKKEVSVLWHHTPTGIDLKSRLDLWHPKGGIVYDLKTTDNASLNSFRYSVKNYRYHVQAAMYLDALTSSGVQDTNGFCFIVVEKSPPFGVAVYLLDDDSIHAGRIEYESNLRTLADCQSSGKWPSYTTQVMQLSIFNNERIM